MIFIGQLQAKPAETKIFNKVKSSTAINNNSNDQLIDNEINNNNIKQNSIIGLIKETFTKFCSGFSLFCSFSYNKLYNYFETSTPKQKSVIICTILSWFIILWMFSRSF